MVQGTVVMISIGGCRYQYRKPVVQHLRILPSFNCCHHAHEAECAILALEIKKYIYISGQLDIDSCNHMNE